MTERRGRGSRTRWGPATERATRTDGGPPQHARPRTPVGVLDRAVAILDAVEGGARSFSAIVDATGLTQADGPPADRVARGPRVPVPRRWPRLRARTAAARPGRRPPCASCRSASSPVRRSSGSRSVTGESAQLYVRDGDRRDLRRRRRVRARAPHDRADRCLPAARRRARPGKVFLAWGPTASAGSIGRGRHRRARVDLPATRRRGWADSYGEREAGVASVSAPVFGPGRSTSLAAVSVSGPQPAARRARAQALRPGRGRGGAARSSALLGRAERLPGVGLGRRSARAREDLVRAPRARRRTS